MNYQYSDNLHKMSKPYVVQKKPDIRAHTMCFLYVKFKVGRLIHGGRRQGGGCLGRKELTGRGPRGFSGIWKC